MWKPLVVPGSDVIMKKMELKAGDGSKAQSGSAVTIHYSSFPKPSSNIDADVLESLSSMVPYDCSIARNSPLSFRLGWGHVIRGLEIAVSSMCNGEVALFEIPPNFGFGTYGCPPVPPKQALWCKVELLRIDDPSNNVDEERYANFPNDELLNNSWEDILRIAEGKKNTGNECFRSEDYNGALRQYLLAEQIIRKKYKKVLSWKQWNNEGIIVPEETLENYAHNNSAVNELSTEELTKQMNRALLPVITNAAICFIKIGKPSRALVACEDALTMDPQNAKALYRKGEAFLVLEQYDMAKKTLMEARKLEPRDSKIIQLLQIANSKTISQSSI